MNIKDRVSSRIEEIYQEVVDMRRDFHMYPEMGMEEYRTAGIVAEKLRSYGLAVTENVVGTGVVAMLEVKNPKGTIAFRADMDALFVTEQNEFPYVSKTEGMMHACGHDGHMASVLGVAKILCEMRDELNCNIKFIFQPDEEDQKGGGAKPMVDCGVLDDVDAIIGAHIWCELPYQTIGMKEGPFFAISDRFKIKVTGKSGHAGYPQLSCDTIPIAAQIIIALQSIVSRHIDPLQPAVISIGTIKGGYRANVISDEVVMSGSLRAFDSTLREEMVEKMDHIVTNIASAHNAVGVLEYGRFYPVLINDPSVTKRVGGIIKNSVDDIKLDKNAEKTMAGEDFACFLEKIPGTFIMIGGAKNDGSMVYPHHHPKFDFDERAMKVMMQVFCMTAFEYFS